MTETNRTDRAAYEAARAAFEALRAQDKAAFVFEAAFSAVGDALTQTGRGVAEAMEDVFSEDFWRSASASGSPSATAPDPAEPPTAKKNAPRSSKKSGGSTKTAGRSSKKKKDDDEA